MDEAPPILADLLARAVPGEFGERDDVYLIPVPGDSFMRLSARATRALRLHTAGMSVELAAAATDNGAGSWDGARLARIRDQLVARATSQTASEDSFGFFGRRQLLAAATVSRIANPLTLLYRPMVAAFAVLAAVAALIFTVGPVTSVSGSDVVFGYLWMLASLVAHEFGHATAVAAFGRRPGPIGFTFYVIYPALYSDVTSAWSLRRRQRVVVDVGGVYFQLLFIAIVSLLGQFVALPGVRLGMVLTGLSVIMTLHPLLKFDGYWMLADALGVANLSKWRATALRTAWAWMRGRPHEPLPWRPLITATVVLHAVASSVFATCFALYLLPRICSALVRYPSYVRAAIADVQQHGTHSSGPWFALAGATVAVLFGLRVVVRLVAQLRSFARRAS